MNTYCLTLPSVAVINIMNRENLRMIDIVWLTQPVTINPWKKSKQELSKEWRQEPEWGTEAEATENTANWLTGLLLSIQKPCYIFNIFPRITCSEVALLTMEWALSHQSLNKKVPHRLAYREYDRGTFFIQNLSSQMTLTSVKLTKN